MFRLLPAYVSMRHGVAAHDCLQARHCRMTHRRAVALMVLVTLLWSIAGVVTRQLQSAHGFEVTFWRSIFNALALIVALSAMRGPVVWRELLRANPVVWMSGVCWALMFTAFMLALTLTTVANVLLTMALGPMVTAIFSRLFLKQALPMRTWSAIFIAALGIVWMFGGQAVSGVSQGGVLVAAIVPLAGSVNLTLLQRVSSRGAGAPDMLPAVFIGALLSAAATLPVAWPLDTTVHDLGWLALLGVFQLAIPCLLMVRLSRQLPAPEIALLALLEVIFGVAWAWLGAGEQPSSPVLLGGSLVLGALVMNEVLGLRRAN